MLKNKALLIKTIQEDCVLQNVYIDNFGNTCAIGGLAKAINFDFSSLHLNQIANGQYIGAGPTTRKMADAIESKFGLELGDQRHIQRLNDSSSFTLEERKAQILAYIETLPLEKEQY